MIYTLTLNPSIDYIISIEKFKEGGINITKSEYKLPGGKGINVSQVLSNLEKESKVLGFIGGFTGEFIKDALKKKDIDSQFIEVEGDTRINIKMKDSKVETEINGNSPEITDKALNSLLSKLKLLKPKDLLVLSGSVPKNITSKIYKEIMKSLDKNIKVILDAKGEALLEGVKGNPYIIKPNNHELGDIFNVTIKNIDETIAYGRKLLEMGAQNIIVSMAGEGALLLTPTKTYFANAPKGKVINSVGAGDSLVGGFTYGISNNLDIVEAFKMGIACGSASAFSKDLCTKEEVEKLIKTIDVKEI